MRKYRPTLLWKGLLLIGLLATGLLLWGRISAEYRDRQACAAISLEDLQLLARESGLPERTWREALRAAGVRYIMGEDTAFVLPQAGMAPTDTPLALVENHARTSVHLPEGFDLEAWEGPLVKTLQLYEDYTNRASGTDTTEIENLLFRAVTDRGLRLLILTPFRNSDGDLLAEPQLYTNCLNSLAGRLADRGITFGQGFSCMEAPAMNLWLILAAGLLPAALGIWLLGAMFPALRRFQWLLCLLIPALMIGCGLVAPALTQKLLMLAAAVLFPCAAVWFMAGLAHRQPAALRGSLWRSALGFLAGLTAWTLLGGLSVSALMATRLYMMEFDIFTGVKLAQYLPVAFGCLLLVRELGRELVGTDLRSWLALGAALTVIAGIWLLLSTRSGDPTWKTFGWERTLRNWLEYSLYARPRTKEFLFAAPCVPLYLWACRRRSAPLQLLCGAGACLQLASVTNTFCHAVAPIHVSLIRSLLGVILGLVIGLALMAAAELLHKRRT